MKILYNNAVIAEIGGMVSQGGAVDWAREMTTGAFDPALVERVPSTPEETKALMREVIAANAGDTLSLVGTINDGSTMLLFHFAKVMVALSSANSLAEVRDATDDFAPIAQSFLDKVETGDVALPFQLKGEAAVMAEIETRATAVTQALQAAQGE